MRAELEHVLAATGPQTTPAQYRAAILEHNAARKDSHTARNWAWLRLKLRYALDSPESPEYAAFRTAMLDPDPIGRGLTAYLMLARTDRLFRESSLRLLVPHISAPATVLDQEKVLDCVDSARSKEGLKWSAASVRQIAAHILTSWKDFGLVEGSKVRRTVEPRPSHATITFAIELSRAEGKSDRQALESRWFTLLGMTKPAVEAALYAAGRAGVLKYRSQADVVEIVLPQDER
jgi:hypothetical protein